MLPIICLGTGTTLRKKTESEVGQENERLDKRTGSLPDTVV